MNDVMTAPARRELVEALRQRYAAATREDKVRILSEFAAVSGLHRKSAIRVLNAQSELAPAKRRGRPCVYDQAVQQGLVTLWEASDRVCGKRLRPLLPLLLGALERHGHIKLDASVRERLLRLSAATIDRMLAPTRAVACRPRPRRKPSRPRQQMPLRTFAEWGGARIGEMEMDLVAHCGAANSGSYVSTLVLTDVVSGWTECAPLVVRSRELVVETVERLRQSLPFTLISLDTDNGTEFVNEVLVDYCSKRGIGLTRSRPYLKNDQAWVEQKNSAVVRRMVGYARLEGITTAQALARLYASARLFVNFFQPSFKLASKEREGARVTPPPAGTDQLPSTTGATNTGSSAPAPATEPKALPTEFYGTASLDPVKAKMEFATLVDEIVQQFTAKFGVEVTISVEIQASSKAGFDEVTQRIVKENCNVLKITGEFE